MPKKYIKNKEKPVQKYRLAIQLLFVAICLWIGLEFYFFTRFLESGGNLAIATRPAGAEAFLPISALMSLYYFFLTGVIHPVHPAGFFIFIAIIAVSFLFGKSFCSWICPVGFISEYIGEFSDQIQKKLFKKIYQLPRWIDYPLRSLKYLLLAFFASAIFFTMTEAALKYFLDSSYNVISDVKMYYFFTEISPTALIIILVLFILSIIIRNFWCRYLCPYGALLGIFSIISPNKIKRDTETCIDCTLCAKACSSKIKVDKVKIVISDECTSCLSCVDVCPVADTLEVKPIFNTSKISGKQIAIGILIIYFTIIGAAMLTGNWNNNVSNEKYLEHFKKMGSIGHPRSTADIEKLNEVSKTKEN